MKKTVLLSTLARRLKNVSQLLNWREAQKILSLDYELKEFRIKDASHVIVLAPHPDDDIFGAGGFIASLNKKCSLHVVYMCNGESGTVTGERDTNLIMVRKKEAQTALSILNPDSTSEFLGQTDGSLGQTPQLVEKLSTLLQEQKPDYILAPWFGDNHEDHQATFSIMHKSCTSIPPVTILLYEVWTPLIPNRYCIIDDFIDTKIAAINKHTSQLETRNYRNAIIGLNSYRAGMIGKGKYAECFIEIPSNKLDSIIVI